MRDLRDYWTSCLLPYQRKGGPYHSKEYWSDWRFQNALLMIDHQSKIDVYTQSLSRVSPTSTVTSHQSTLRSFANWAHATQSDIAEKSIAIYAECSLTHDSVSTVAGQVDTLANYLAYIQQDDPKLVKIRVSRLLLQDSERVSERRQAELSRELDISTKPSPSERIAIKSVIDYLRQSRSGTQPHVLTEIILDTKGRPSTIRAVNVPHVDLNEQTIEVTISENHAIGSEIFQTRVTSLSPSTAAALETYISHERTSPSDLGDETPPLFSTSHGRASASTLRRKIKQASETALCYPIVDAVDQPAGVDPDTVIEEVETITPSDLWRYSVTQITG